MTLDEAKQIRGAVYIPAPAFNAYQMWRDYDRDITQRDLAYAAKLKLNALCVFLSYEYFLEDRKRMENCLYHLLQTAQGNKIRIMPVLFDACGIPPTDEAKLDRDPATAVCIQSPHADLMNAPNKWFEVAEFVNWFMQRFSHEPRVLALEIINEPKTAAEFKFTRAMFSAASRHRRSVPLTFGALSFEDSRLLADLPLDILQIHENFHHTEQDLRRRLDRAAETQEILAKPVLLTEWQRLRTHALGWAGEKLDADEWQPAYRTMASIVHSYPLGNFFWSLMLKRAYLAPQRKNGTINGVFHENGAVWSLADARAISGDETFTAEERSQPSW